MNRSLREFAYRGSIALFALIAVSFAAGCGGAPRSKVTGKVTMNGQPVKGGSLSFAPLATDSKSNAKPATAEVQEDGTFVVGTDKPDDGAAIGKHQVLYSPPPSTVEWDGYGEPPPGLTSPYEGLIPKQAEIEVKAGDNDLTIELVPNAAFAQSGVSPGS
jgi:hypothetical protein